MALSYGRGINSALFTIFLSLFVFSGNATHLVGGDLNYEYLGDTDGNGDPSYRITFTTYIDCNSQYWPGSFPEPSLRVGIYKGPADPNTDLPMETTVLLNLVDSAAIEPGDANNCTVGSGICLYQVTYSNELELPLTFSEGFHIFYERCCRNPGILNLANSGEEAFSFHAYIPPTVVENSSPSFDNVSTPFICVGDTTTILNSAIEPDGDVVVFSFVAPNSSDNATMNNPAPALPDPLEWPVPDVNYAAGYGVANPFGGNGYAFINGSSGLTEYFIPNAGQYAIGIEIREYRNGDLIGMTRRGLQLQAIDCPSNDDPNLSPQGGSGKTSYTIEAGDSLCFPITFEDPEGDEIELTSNGLIFDPSEVSPPATINTPISGTGKVTADFCWNTTCDMDRPLPYLFTVSAEDDGCPPKTSNVVYEIEVEPPEEPKDIQGPDPVCSNDSLYSYTTDTIAGADYDWSVNGGTISGGSDGPAIDVNWDGAGSGTLKVVVTSEFGCASEPVERSVDILSAPEADAGSDTLLCGNDSVRIGGDPTGPPGATYIWSPSGPLDSASSPNPKASPNGSTDFVVRVEGASGCVSRDTVTVKKGLSSIKAKPDTAICKGDSIRLEANGAQQYEWAPATGLSDTTGADPKAYPDSTTTYVVTGTDTISGSACKGKDSVTVQVDPLPFVDAGPDTAFCEGDSVRLGGDPAGPPGASYTWSPGTGLDSTEVPHPWASSPVDSLYRLTVTDSNGCRNTDTVALAIDSLPSLEVSPDTTICAGDSVQLNGTPGYKDYAWMPVGGVTDPAIPDPIAFPGDSTWFVLEVTDSNACSSSDSLHVAVKPLPGVDAGPDGWICPGDSLKLEGSGADSYIWSPGLTLNDSTISDPMAGPDTTTEYLLEGTDALGCRETDSVTVFANDTVPTNAGPDTLLCEGDTIQLGGDPTAPPGTDYDWTPKAWLEDASQANPEAFPDSSTSFVVRTVNDTCSNADTVTVQVSEGPELEAGPDEQICKGDSVQLEASGGRDHQWTPDDGLSDPADSMTWAFPADTTRYRVTSMDSNGCMSADSLWVVVNPLPNVNAGQDIEDLCRGDSVQLQASGGTNYTWRPATGLSDSSVADPTAFPDTTRGYRVHATDSNGCAGRDSLTVEVFRIAAGPDTAICSDQGVQLWTDANKSSSWNWSPARGLSDPSSPSPKASPDSSVTYLVTGTADNGCTDSHRVFMNVRPAPEGEVSLSRDLECEGVRVQLRSQTSGGDDELSWIFWDGDTLKGPNASRTIPYDTPWGVELRVEAANSCRDSLALQDTTGKAEDLMEIGLPNVFTPNGDGKNDRFTIDDNGDFNDCIDLKVYNRWGELMFRSSGRNVTWEGRTSVGEKVPEGTYIVTAKIRGIKIQRTVTLMR